MNKKVLLVSFIFPPFPGIGGRRWAKFSKELAADGYTIYVLAAQNPFKENSAWLKDIEHNPRIIVKYLPLNYPKILMGKPRNFFEKISYRYQLLRIKLKTRGNYFDRAVNWKEMILNESEKIIRKESLKNIIVSGAPFHLAHHLLPLKKKYSDLNLIVDFRDPWANNAHFFGFPGLARKRMEHEKKMEQEVIETADKVISVAPEMNDYFKKKVPGSKADFLVLENGFDESDLIYSGSAKADNGKVKFIFTGTLYPGIEYVFAPFVKTLQNLRRKNSELFDKFCFDFYGDSPFLYRKMAEEYNLKNVNFHNKIPLRVVYEKISGSNICMLFLSENLGFSLSTKFCEYLAMKKKIIVFSNPGKTTEFVLNNNLGYSAGPDEIENMLLRIYDDYKNGQLGFNSQFDIKQFSLPVLTKKLTGCFKWD